MRWIVAISSCLWLACGSAEQATSTPDVATPRQPKVSATFSVFGTPGPWWREDGTNAAFQKDLKLCVTYSNTARLHAKDPASAAYQGFIDCMTQKGWSRGQPPLALPPA